MKKNRVNLKDLPLVKIHYIVLTCPECGKTSEHSVVQVGKLARTKANAIATCPNCKVTLDRIINWETHKCQA